MTLTVVATPRPGSGSRGGATLGEDAITNAAALTLRGKALPVAVLAGCVVLAFSLSRRRWAVRPTAFVGPPVRNHPTARKIRRKSVVPICAHLV